jgi:hypothetical protein
MEIFDFLRPQGAHKAKMRAFLAKACSIWRADRGKFAVVFMISLGLHMTVILFFPSFQMRSQ